MRKPIEIGKLIFKTKKDALGFFKQILNAYEFGESISSQDFEYLNELIKVQSDSEELIGCGLQGIRIAKLKYNTKGFELVKNDKTTQLISYTKRINPPRTDITKFREACRQAIQEDLRNVKLSYFDNYSKKGKAKCQETGELLKYDELNVDHRQPNTFSVIVDRFVELKNIDFKNIDYLTIDGGPNELVDKKLKEDFRQYHKDKANLRIVKKTLNLGRSFQARVNRQKKDLTI
jgi:hypothetical protein